MLEDLIYRVNGCDDVIDLMSIAVNDGLNLNPTERRLFLMACIDRIQLLTIF